MDGIQVVTKRRCASCGAGTDRKLGNEWVCLECEMRQHARHCVRLPGLRASDALDGYLGRPPTEDEAEAFTRHYLETAEARPE